MVDQVEGRLLSITTHVMWCVGCLRHLIQSFIKEGKILLCAKVGQVRQGVSVSVSVLSSRNVHATRRRMRSAEIMQTYRGKLYPLKSRQMVAEAVVIIQVELSPFDSSEELVKGFAGPTRYVILHLGIECWRLMRVAAKGRRLRRVGVLKSTAVVVVWVRGIIIHPHVVPHRLVRKHCRGFD